MAGRVEFSTSITPIVTIAAVSYASAEHDVIESDIGKSFGGSASIATTSSTAHTTVAYSSGSPAYGKAIANGGTKVQLGADASDYKMVFIKHTGFEYTSSSELSTTANTQSLIEDIESTANMATSAKFTIPDGGAVCIPSIDLGTAMGLWTESAGDATIAIEYALIT